MEKLLVMKNSKMLNVFISNLNIEDNAIKNINSAAAINGSRVVDGNDGDLIYTKADFKLEVYEGESEPISIWNQIFVGHIYLDSDDWFMYSGVAQFDASLSSNLYGFYDSNPSGKLIKNRVLINLTKEFGKGNEPTTEQMDALLEIFPNSWFYGTKNIFNAKHFMKMYFKKINELENAITTLGGELP